MGNARVMLGDFGRRWFGMKWGAGFPEVAGLLSGLLGNVELAGPWIGKHYASEILCDRCGTG